MDSPRGPLDSNPIVRASLRNLVLQVYRSVWEEYSEWSDKHTASSLKSLETSLQELDLQEKESPDTCHITADNDLLFTTSEFNADGFIVEEYETKGTSIIVDQTLRSHPPYESCTPIARNLMVGDDPDDLPFIPFADDPTYNFLSDIEEYSCFRWQEPFIDSDLEVVACETVQQLIEKHAVTPEDIDRTAILPLPCDTLINLHKKRDSPKEWPINKLTFKSADSPERTMDYFLGTFCNILNCITGFCATHLETQTPTFNPSKVPYQKLGNNIAHPCGMQCFLQPPMISTSLASATIWTTEDNQLLFSILHYAPDVSPCDLAKMCHKPCREVHVKRANYRSPVKPAEKGKNINSSTHRNYEESTKFFTQQLPCKHDGACDARSSCACFSNKAHCHTRCGCSKTCPRQRKGCACATSKAGKVCGTKKCSCFRANFECDPEVCITCEARSAVICFCLRLSDLTLCSDHKSDLCRNVGIQRGKFKRTEIRESKWGLGLFILEPCEKGELVVEYVGELIYESTLRSRDFVASHRKRSYVFVLNPTFSVDAANAGNSSRYINHNSDPNCNTTVCLVNGEHRIGVFAARRIREGEELFIDYGPVFFKDKSNIIVDLEATGS